MGDAVAPSPYYQGKQEETRTLGEFLGELCAYYMALGMPRDEFYDTDERFSYDDYEKAWECKEIYRNQTLHLMGVYNTDAFGTVLSNAFAKKGSKGKKYMEYPIPTTETERKAEKQRKILHTLKFVRERKRGNGDGGTS